MPPPRILILYNEPVLPLDHPDAASEREILQTADRIAQTLTAAGYRLSRLAVGASPTGLLPGLRKARPDVVFNLFEGLATQGQTEATVAGVLEWLGLPYTGSPPLTLTLARDKCRTKHLLQGAGLPTAPFLLVGDEPCPPCTLDWPVIVKPALQDASVGIEQGSIVTNQADLERRVEYVRARYGPPVLAEQYVPGREFHVSLLDEPGEAPPLVLPLAEVLFLEKDPAYWPIYSYDAKWRTDSHEYQMTPLESPARIEPELAERVGLVARRAYRLLGCRDYARVDVRLTPDGRPFVLEVNPNPFIHSIAMSNGLEAVGRSHDRFVVGLVEAALARQPVPVVVQGGGS